jgi:hypothetical protein
MELDDEAAAHETEIDTVQVPGLPPTSRKVRRERRRRVRSKTFAMKRLTVAEREIFAVMYPAADDAAVEETRPQTRADCRGQQRPCPWVACKHHLYLDINPLTGSIKINFPDLEPWELQHTCALDVAEAGALTLEQVGEITNLTRERIRQVESLGLAKLASQTRRFGLG